jgi:hypothetical protein
MSYPFARSPVTATWANDFYYSSTDAPEVALYSLGGQLRRLVRLPRPDRPVTGDVIERLKQERLASVSDERFRPGIEALFAKLPFPETMPSYSSLKVDPDGNLWAAEYQVPGTGQPLWFVFNSSGRFLGEVAMPTGFNVYQIGRDFVLGRRTDELGVERVEIYPLGKNRS